uniref:hypothetical protein n=1 Tax=Streptomyces sp. NBC_01001 TaxID=2903713 RepID=UPI002F907DD2|nr:hypothetical protein OG296_42225 [Streptomyces sp. NBC_01001]
MCHRRAPDAVHFNEEDVEDGTQRAVHKLDLARLAAPARGPEHRPAALRLPLVGRTIRGRELATGAVIGVAQLTGCHQDPDSPPPCTPWAQPNAWHLELTDVQALAVAIRAAAVTRTRGKKPSWEPGLIPAPGGLLDWRDSQHFDCWQDRPYALCEQPTPMRSHYCEPAHKACTEDWIAVNPTEDRLGRFVSDAQPKRRRDDDHA